MKTATIPRISPWCLVGLALLCTSPHHRAGAQDDPFADADGPGPTHLEQVGIFVEYIQVEAATATKLVRKHAGAADATKFRDEVGELVDAEKAELIESSYLLTRPGRRAKVESIHEMIYPTEYDPPGPPQSFGTVPADPNDFSNIDISIGVSPPTAFEVRNVGNTVEIEPNIVGEGGSAISLNIAPEIVEFVRFTTYGQGDSETLQPLFYVLKLATKVTIQDGGYVLAAVQMPRDKKAENGEVRADPSSRVLVFIRAKIIKVPLKSND